MPRPITWRSLIPGLLIASVIIAFIGFVIFRTQIGGLSGPTFPLYVAGPDVGGIVPGSEVWLAGQRVGAVERIVFRPPTVSAGSRLLVQLKVLDRARPAIRTDSRVDFRSGGTVIGVQVVYLSIGTSRAPMVQKGDTLFMAPPPGVGAVADKAIQAIHELPAIMTNVHHIAEDVTSSESTMTTIGAEVRTIAAVWAPSHPAQLTAQSRLQSKVGQAQRLDSLLTIVTRSGVARAESTEAMALRRRDDLGALLQDSALRSATNRLARDQALIRSTARGNDAALERAQGDTAVQGGVAGALHALRALLVDMTAHPFRYIASL